MPNSITVAHDNKSLFGEILRDGEKGQIQVAVSTSIFQFIWYACDYIFLEEYRLLFFFLHLIVMLSTIGIVIFRKQLNLSASNCNYIAMLLMSAICMFVVHVCPENTLEIFVTGAVILFFGIGTVGLWKFSQSVFFVLGSLSANFIVYLLIGTMSLQDYLLNCILPISISGLIGIIVLKMRLNSLFRELKMKKMLELVQKNLINQKNKVESELEFLIYSISHDLRSPILSVKGLLMLIRDFEKLNPDCRDYLKMAEASVNRLDQMIYDILDFADNAKIELKYEEFNMHEMVEEIFNDLKFLSKIPIEFYIEIEGPEIVYSDKKRLKTIIKNLASNAVKYHRKGTEKAFVKFIMLQETNKVEFQVEDNGRGIPQEQQQKIFEMFYRYASDISGSGLGLFIVKEVLTKICGKIELESVLDKGSVFKVMVPVVALANTDANS
jgi:signal transduction histidine kinase